MKWLIVICLTFSFSVFACDQHPERGGALKALLLKMSTPRGQTETAKTDPKSKKWQKLLNNYQRMKGRRPSSEK